MKKPGVEFTFFKWRVRFLNYKISKSQWIFRPVTLHCLLNQFLSKSIRWRTSKIWENCCSMALQLKFKPISFHLRVLGDWTYINWQTRWSTNISILWVSETRSSWSGCWDPMVLEDQTLLNWKTLMYPPQEAPQQTKTFTDTFPSTRR